MKKLLISFMLLLLLVGCAGVAVNPAAQTAADTGFYLVLQANPQYKAPVIAGLTALNVFLSGSVTYDQLTAEIAKQLPAPYDMVAAVLTGFISSDTPVSTSLLPMSAAYKAAITGEINKLLLVAQTVKG